jgi:hypothetical protein
LEREGRYVDEHLAEQEVLDIEFLIEFVGRSEDSKSK